MNYYPHHIGDFNNATRHLTRVERALYRELIELYYDTEQPLPAGDFPALCKKVLATDPQEKEAVASVLMEFFVKEEGVYRHARCDQEIASYRAKLEGAIKAGRASAESRANAKLAKVKRSSNGRSTNAQPTNNQEPVTNNQEPERSKAIVRANGAHHPAVKDESPIVAQLPLREGGEFPVRQSLVSELEPIYPHVDVPKTLLEMRGWLLLNAERRKTNRGIKRFIGNWLQGEEEKHGG